VKPEQIAILRTLVHEQRVLSLAVLAEGQPVIGLLPFALAADGAALVVHASRLARHTRGLVEGATFDALIHEPDAGDRDPLQVRRMTLRGTVRALADDPARHAADRADYLAKFPAAEPVTALGDFAFYRLEIAGGRLVSGFGGAVNLRGDALPALLTRPGPT
jgi:hypothetical protein